MRPYMTITMGAVDAQVRLACTGPPAARGRSAALHLPLRPAAGRSARHTGRMPAARRPPRGGGSGLVRLAHVQASGKRCARREAAGARLALEAWMPAFGPRRAALASVGSRTASALFARMCRRAAATGAPPRTVVHARAVNAPHMGLLHAARRAKVIWCGDGRPPWARRRSLQGPLPARVVPASRTGWTVGRTGAVPAVCCPQAVSESPARLGGVSLGAPSTTILRPAGPASRPMSRPASRPACIDLNTV